MALYDLTREHAAYHQGKVNELTPESQRRWGEMTVERMMRHLRRTIELSLDDPNGELKRTVPPVIGPILGWLFFDVLTNWPKGRIKAPPALVTDAHGSFEEEKALLLKAIDEFAARCEAAPNAKQLHPLIGMITLRRWAHIHGVHMNHHYRQFGLV